MVVNFALTKNLKRYSRSGLSRRRALYKLLKNKKAVNTRTHKHIPTHFRYLLITIFITFISIILFFYHTYFYYYSPQRRSPLRSASPAST